MAILSQLAKPALFKHEGLLSSPRAAQGIVITLFHEEERWMGAGFPCFSLQLSCFFESIYVFKGLLQGKDPETVFVSQKSLTLLSQFQKVCVEPDLRI